MLGPVGKTAKRALTKAGYELTRPTVFEREQMRSYWEDWLSHDPATFARLYAGNRETLARIERWIDDAALTPSLWRYGVPAVWDTQRQGLGNTGLNEVEKEVTYTDLIASIASQITSLRYLEIGVSVGKNFLQIIDRFPDADIVGLDVEDLNPRVAQEFERVETVWQSDKSYEVETLSGRPASIKLTILKLHRKNGKPVTYIKGDQFSSDTWAAMDAPFNFIFSDGVHSGRALLDERDHLNRNNLIDTSGNFAMYWDDLINIEMQTAFNSCADTLTQKMPNLQRGLHSIHGTYGSKRLNGVVANFEL